MSTNLPPSGLHGDYTGSCVVCLNGTETAVAFEGEAEWVIAGFTVLGVMSDQSRATLAESAPERWQDGKVPAGRVTEAVRVCGDCAGRAGFPVGLIDAGVSLPGVVQA